MARTHFSGPLVVGGKQLTDHAPIADVTAVDADTTYDAAEAALLNALKATVNAILAALRDAGIVQP